MIEIKKLASIVDDAAKNATPINQLTGTHTFNESEAYAIQAASLKRRYLRGERLVGLKLGFTSRLKMLQMGVHDMIWGRLTDKMILEEGGNLQFDQFIHPRAEPEICFLIKKKIEHPITLLEAGQYIEAIAPALEIIDSRYENFKFSLEDVIADNCSSAGVVLGKWHNASTAIENLGIVLEVNQRPVQIGSSAAILGNPLRSVVAAARLAIQYEERILPGSILLAGAATPAVYIQKGDHIQARVEKLGRVAVNVI